MQWEGSECSGRGQSAVGGVRVQWEGSECSGRGPSAVGGVRVQWEGSLYSVVYCRRVLRR